MPRPHINWIMVDATCFRVDVGSRYEVRRRAHDVPRPGWWDIFRDNKWLNAFPMMFAAKDFVAGEVAKREAA